MIQKRIVITIFLLVNIVCGQNTVFLKDTAFAIEIRRNCKNCIKEENILDTINALNVRSLYIMKNPNVHDVYGVKYFKNLDTLVISETSISTLPKLPSRLKLLDCSGNKLVNINEDIIPFSVLNLYLDRNFLKELPDLNNAIRTLSISSNRDLEIPMKFPDSLRELVLSGIVIDSRIFDLPSKVEVLYLSNCQLKGIPKLPQSIKELYISKNQIKTVSSFPESLLFLDLSFNQIELLPQLPKNLRYLYVSENNLKDFPEIPKGMLEIQAANNCFTKLPQTSNREKEHFFFSSKSVGCK